MKKKFLSISLIIIIFAFIVLQPVTSMAATYTGEGFSINIPSNYYIEEQSSNEILVTSNDGTKSFSVTVSEDQFDYTLDQEYLEYLIEAFKSIFGEGFRLISSDLVESNGCKGLRIQFVEVSTGVDIYVEEYQFKSDNYSYMLMFLAYDQNYLTSQEKNNIFNSFVIKDTVTSSYGIPFTDVPSQSWFFSSVKYTYERGIILGTSETTFNPNTKLTRGMLVTILHRMEGKPTPTTQNKFNDVYKALYYYDAIRWATEKGIVHGYDDGSGNFGPDDNVTRQDLAVILRNYAQYKGKNVNVTTDLTKFKDGNLVSDYAKTAMQWAVRTGVINGNDTTSGPKTLTPHANSSRAEVAAMIYNYCTKVK